MAQINRRLSENVTGEFFVDATCIDCDACQQIATATFRDHGGQSSVYRQPRAAEDTHRALMALVACPTGSIGTVTHLNARAAAEAYPERIVDNVYFCGFTAEASFGAWSYLIVRDDRVGGNILIDSPRFTLPLVKQIERLGGVRLMFLTHRDDIVDHAKFAARFGCPRLMHASDGAVGLGIERVVTGEDAVAIDEELVCFPTPGHTRGHQVLLYRQRVLFTGDHLAWSPEREALVAFKDACWYSWPEQTRSMQRLLAYDFRWVLPGHGRIHHAPAAVMRDQLRRCVASMQGAPAR